GRTDLAVANFGASNVAILLGSSTQGPTISSAHSGDFTQNQFSASYLITLQNGGPTATSGTVTVTDQLPAGLTATNITGTGWSCVLATLPCPRSDPLPAGQSFPVIGVVVRVAPSAASLVINQVTASVGGGPPITASDPTVILPAITGPILASPANGA